jgi:hypothetical protein
MKIAFWSVYVFFVRVGKETCPLLRVIHEVIKKTQSKSY